MARPNARLVIINALQATDWEYGAWRLPFLGQLQPIEGGGNSTAASKQTPRAPTRILIYTVENTSQYRVLDVVVVVFSLSSRFIF